MALDNLILNIRNTKVQAWKKSKCVRTSAWAYVRLLARSLAHSSSTQINALKNRCQPKAKSCWVLLCVCFSLSCLQKIRFCFVPPIFFLFVLFCPQIELIDWCFRTKLKIHQKNSVDQFLLWSKKLKLKMNKWSFFPKFRNENDSNVANCLKLNENSTRF